MRAHIDVDARTWMAALDRLPAGSRDVYFRPDFHRAHAENGDGVPHCSIVEDGESFLLIPGLRVAIDDGHWDLQTCRTGCAGPLSNAGDTPFLERAWSLWKTEMARRGAVAALFRPHPLLATEQYLPEGATVDVDRYVAFVDLREGRERAWQGAETRHRNMVRKARQVGLAVTWQDDRRAFVDLYRASMERLGADRDLRFGPGFFDALWDLPFAQLALAREGGRLTAGAVFLFGDRWAHYYLSARDHAAGNYATSLLIDAALDRAADAKLDGLYLGGGRSTAPDDDLLRFKRSIASDRLPYRMARLVIDDAAYERLTRSWTEAAGVQPTWLLGYRQPMAERSLDA
jgi:Acetyltransferase (GNAT) domain